MDASNAQETSNQNLTLQVDFTWKKWKALITEKGNTEAKPVCIVDFKMLKPHLVFHSGIDNSVFGTGSLHPISINADCEVHGKPANLKAIKRWVTSYTHLSHTYSKTDKPVQMTWASDSDFKTWDFICLNQDHLPVAKYSARIWGIKKIGYIEFMGPTTDEQRDEMIATGMTLFYCMILRTTNILNFFGAIFARPGKSLRETQAAAEKPTSEDEAAGVTAQDLKDAAAASRHDSADVDKTNGSAPAPGRTVS